MTIIYKYKWIMKYNKYKNELNRLIPQGRI